MMAQDTQTEFEAGLMSLIADTFDVRADRITASTCPGDIDGWDSLGHSVLLTRLSRRFHIPINEELAAPILNVSELVGRLTALQREHVHG